MDNDKRKTLRGKWLETSKEKIGMRKEIQTFSVPTPFSLFSFLFSPPGA